MIKSILSLAIVIVLAAIIAPIDGHRINHTLKVIDNEKNMTILDCNNSICLGSLANKSPSFGAKVDDRIKFLEFLASLNNISFDKERLERLKYPIKEQKIYPPGA